MNKLEHLTTFKAPATELIDLEFHAAVIADTSISTFDTWMADCYHAIMQYSECVSMDDKKTAALRIGRTAWEAAEAKISTGFFLNAICENWMDGIRDGRSAFDWQQMGWNTVVEKKYIAKTLRHFIHAEIDVPLGSQTKHLAALYCNANILWRQCGDIAI